MQNLVQIQTNLILRHRPRKDSMRFALALLCALCFSTLAYAENASEEIFYTDEFVKLVEHQPLFHSEHKSVDPLSHAFVPRQGGLCESISLLIHTATFHDSGDFNGANTGAGLECRVRGLSVGAGGYWNSVKKYTLYEMVAKDWRVGSRFEAGVMAGVATGYWKLLVPVAAGRLGFILDEQRALRLIMIPRTPHTPATFHLVLEGKFQAK